MPAQEAAKIAATIEALLQQASSLSPRKGSHLALQLYQHADRLCVAGHTERVLGWLRGLPGALRKEDPLIAASEATALGRAGRYREALQIAEEIWNWRCGHAEKAGPFAEPAELPADFDHHLAWLVAGFRYHCGRYQESGSLISQYLSEHEADEETERRLRMIGFFALRYSGSADEALAYGHHLMEICGDQPLMQVKVAGVLSGIYIDRCQFARARELMAAQQSLLSRRPENGLRSHLFTRLREIAVWEGDYAEALRMSEHALAAATSSGDAYYRTQAILMHVQVLNLLGRTAETGTWLEKLEEGELSGYHGVLRDIAWALFQARHGRRDLAVQRIARAVTQFEQGPAEGDQHVLVDLALAADEASAPSTDALIAMAQERIPPEYPGLRARLCWLQARQAYRAGRPVAGPLGEFVTLCERHGLAGLLHHAAAYAPEIIMEGLEEGVASALYAAAMPDPDEENAAGLFRLAADVNLPDHVRRVAFQLLARRPEHPQTQAAVAALSDGPDCELRRAACRLVSSAKSGAGSLLEVRSLGGFEVLLRGEPISRKWRKKAQLLFMMLLHQSPRPVNRNLLAETLWPDLAPKAAANNLRVSIHEIRQALAGAGESPGFHCSLIAADADAIRLCLGERILWDVRQLERLSEVARKALEDGKEDVAVTALRRVVDLHKGTFMPGPAFDGYFDLERRHFARLAYDAALNLAAFCLDRKDPEQALAAAEAAARLEPLDEQNVMMVMRAHSALGFPNRAMQAYRRYEEILAQETGERPSQTARQLLSRLVTA